MDSSAIAITVCKGRWTKSTPVLLCCCCAQRDGTDSIIVWSGLMFQIPTSRPIGELSRKAHKIFEIGKSTLLESNGQTGILLHRAC